MINPKAAAAEVVLQHQGGMLHFLEQALRAAAVDYELPIRESEIFNHRFRQHYASLLSQFEAERLASGHGLAIAADLVEGLQR